MEDSIKAVAYIYSATNNKEGIDRQRQAINDYATENKITIKDWLVDTDGSRYSLYKLTNEIPEGINCVVTTETNRISRSVQEYKTIVDILRSNNVEVRTLGTSFDSVHEWFMDDMSKIVGRLNHEHISGRVKLGMQRKVESGLYPFRPPFGYELSGTKNLYKPSHATRELGEYLHQAANNEISVETLHAIAKKLFGLKKPVSMKKLKQIALNPFYAGVTRFDGKCYQGSHQPIVSREDQKQLEELFA